MADQAALDRLFAEIQSLELHERDNALTEIKAKFDKLFAEKMQDIKLERIERGIDDSESALNNLPQQIGQLLQGKTQAKGGPLSQKGLRCFPAEVRESIFYQALEDPWHGKTPALIQALRGDQELYHEALYYFYQTNTFVLGPGNFWSFRDMAESAVKTISKIKIEIRDWPETEDEMMADALRTPGANWLPAGGRDEGKIQFEDWKQRPHCIPFIILYYLRNYKIMKSCQPEELTLDLGIELLIDKKVGEPCGGYPLWLDMIEETISNEDNYRFQLERFLYSMKSVQTLHVKFIDVNPHITWEEDWGITARMLKRFLDIFTDFMKAPPKMGRVSTEQLAPWAHLEGREEKGMEIVTHRWQRTETSEKEYKELLELEELPPSMLFG